MCDRLNPSASILLLFLHTFIPIIFSTKDIFIYIFRYFSFYGIPLQQLQHHTKYSMTFFNRNSLFLPHCLLTGSSLFYLHRFQQALYYKNISFDILTMLSIHVDVNCDKWQQLISQLFQMEIQMIQLNNLWVISL